MVEDGVAWLPHSPMLLPYFPHMVVALESFQGCLLASCVAPPSFWATKGDPSSTILLLLFTGTRNPSSNQFCLPSTNKFSPMLERGTSTCTFSSHLHFYTFFASCTRFPKEVPTRRNFGFLVIFSQNHSPKILLTYFLGHQLASGFLLVTE